MADSQNDTIAEKHSFLSGGGEMGELMRIKDWSKTPVGNPCTWPQSLRTALSIILNSRFPMFLWWGPELVCFYNDAYRPSLGNNGKHPGILGQPAEEAWPEIWHIIKPLIDQVLTGGEATWSEDQLIPIYRNGKMEDVYWTFSYSPVNDESGKPAGVFVTCVETTKTVNNKKNLEESERNLRLMILQAPAAIAIVRGSEHIVEIINSKALELLGRTEDMVLNKPILEGLPELWGQEIKALLDEVYVTGKSFSATELPMQVLRNGALETIFLNFSYEVLYNDKGAINGIMAVGMDVTEQVLTRQKVEVSDQRFQAAVKAIDGILWTNNAGGEMEGPQPGWQNLTGQGYDQYQGYGWAGAVHPDDAQPTIDAWKEALRENKHFVFQHRVRKRNGEYGTYSVRAIPLFHQSGAIREWVGVHTDITREKLAEEEKEKIYRRIEESEQRFRNSVKQAPLGIAIFRGPNFVTELANETYLQIVDKTESEFIGLPLFETLPEVKELVEPLFKEVIETGKAFKSPELSTILNRYGAKELSYFNLIYHPLREESGAISGIMVVAMEVTESVNAKHSLEEKEKHFRNMVMQSPVAMAIFRGRGFVIEMANTIMLETLWKKKEADVIGRSILQVFPELKTQKYPELLNKVLTGGEVHRETESIAYVQHKEGLTKFYLDFEYAPLFEKDVSISGIMVTVNDVTDKVEARKKVEEAEERMRLAAEATELATWELDLVSYDIIYSPRLPEIFGFDGDKILLHREMRSCIHPDDVHTIVEHAFVDALITGVYKYEARVVKPDKSICWIRTQGKVFYDDQQRPNKMIGTLRDITEEKYYQQVLEESEEKFRLLADSMPQFVWTGDAEGKLNYFNESMCRYSGLSPEQLMNGGWIDIIHPDDREPNMLAWKHSIATGSDFLFEHRFRGFDGEYRWQLSRATPQKDAGGHIQMWVGASTDIQEMKELDQQKDYFISMASHELKTPITSIKGYVQILQSIYNKSEDGFLKNSLNIVGKQVTTLTDLVSDLLDLSKIKSGSLVLNKEDFPMNDLIEEIITEIEHINPGCVINFSTSSTLMVHADRGRIGQVLINLLTNAIKYSPDDCEIFVESKLTRNNVTISVKDSGIGISKKDQEKIFERFYRVEGKNEKTYPGFGIGLFIAAEIIHRHSGKIGVESETGKGSEFYFSLPVGQLAEDLLQQ
ncbi:MAG TPA: PAS domain-containing protein [Agriterribacter sp.]|nr:PAS domain-containing protein [Agriterribacter sp.]